MESIIAFCEKYQPLTEKSLEDLKTCLAYKKIQKNLILDLEGDIPKYIYYVKSGIVRSFNIIDDKDVTFNFYFETDFTGDAMSYITGLPAYRSFQVVEDSELIFIEIKKLRELFQSNHQIANLGRILTEKYVIDLNNYRKMYSGKTAKQRYNALFKAKPEIFNQVKLTYIASFLDMTLETLSRIRNTLK